MKIDPNTSEWLNLAARWFHVFTGILWIGQTYLFTWLDGQLRDDEDGAAKGDGPRQVWMVHSGGFYVVEKQKTPAKHKLHWFRYEALLTWVSGMVLLTLLYYTSDALLIDRDVRDISLMTGVAIGLGLLIVAWVVYDLLSLSPLARMPLLFAAVAYALIVGVAYGLTQVFSGRAAYIHVGAMFGTIMMLNVWMRILPGQRRMIAAAREGKQPDEKLAARAKLRSKHNTFMVVPLIFTMISNHFAATTYGEKYNWVILSILVLVGWGAALLIRKV
ncbi:MAG TPA: urate hydroxylase PuuD [Pyrinomonadaceae bacterium]|jgi:uncharacterized membrane protein|nr:urate hydroxylase PuuD [Pyrinomonadaceae bacterium]